MRVNNCSELHYFQIMFVSADVYALKIFGGGSDSIVLDNVQCTGNEASLSNCSALSVYDCEHSDVAGVTCLSGKLYTEKNLFNHMLAFWQV